MRELRAAVLALGAAVVGLVASPLSHADTVSSVFTPSAIPDNSPTGLTLAINSAPAIASLDQVSVTMSHEWLGDLTVEIIPPTGPALTLFDRLDVTTTNPDGSSAILGTFVFNSSHQGVLIPQSYQFAATGANFEAAAQNAVLTLAAPVVPNDQVYAAQSWTAGPFPAGAWRLFVADSAELSTGLIGSAQLSFTPMQVPEPRVLLLSIAAAGFGVIRRLTKAGRATAPARSATHR
jgi:subtilisin-like proprotein convertase family protein